MKCAEMYTYFSDFISISIKRIFQKNLSTVKVISAKNEELWKDNKQVNDEATLSNSLMHQQNMTCNTCF